MMLFWAGLRGAVGVALAAGMKGENAIALRTTVLVTVVLSVVVFGGTIGRMIEILGIRTGVEEEGDDESDDEEGVYGMMSNGLNGDDDEERSGKKNKKGLGVSTTTTTTTAGGARGNSGKYEMELDQEEDDNSPYRDRFSPIVSNTPNRNNNSNNHLNKNNNRRSSRTTGSGTNKDSYHLSSSHNNESQSSSASDSDPDLLPSASLQTTSSSSSPSTNTSGGPNLPRVWRDGQWFTVLDERYLLPVFSNATASRRQASKKALKANNKRQSISVDNNNINNLGDNFDEDGVSPNGSEPSSPYLETGHGSGGNGGGGKVRDFRGSFSDILSSLVTSPVVTNSTSTSSSYNKKRESEDLSSSTPSPGDRSRNGSPPNRTLDLNLNLSSASSRSGTASPRRTGTGGGTTPKLTSVGLAREGSTDGGERGGLVDFDGR